MPKMFDIKSEFLRFHEHKHNDRQMHFYTAIYKLKMADGTKHTLRIQIRYDRSYHDQCYATIQLFDKREWKDLAYLFYSEMKSHVPPGTESAFVTKDDVSALLKEAETILEG